MADDRSELLRTQAVQHLLTALGAANVQVYGHDVNAGGVFLHDDRTVSHITYWHEACDDDTTGMRRFQYDVRVSVDVYRKQVPNAR